MAVIGHHKTFLDSLRRGSPTQWLILLAASMPWIRFNWEGWAIYPGHWLLSLLLLVLLRHSRVRRGGPGGLPLKPGLWLGLYICLMAGLRGQWTLLAVTGGALLLLYAWGWAAWRMGNATDGTGSFSEGQVLLMAMSMVLGLAVWAGMYFWPPLCAVLACAPMEGGPFPFLGGWATPGQFLIFLLINLPMVGSFAIMLYRTPHQTGSKTLLAMLLVACVMGLMAGARLWMLALAVLAVIGAVWRLAPLTQPGDSWLGRGLALATALAALVVYGLTPSYLTLAARGVTGGALLRVAYPQPPPVRLSSEMDTPIRLKLTNTGLVTLAGGSEASASLGARLLITPEQSRTRAIDVARLPLKQPLAPGRSVAVEIVVRLPHWVREGYLAWVLDSGKGDSVAFSGKSQSGDALSGDSQSGFRFINRHFRDLNQERGNFLTAQSERARDFGTRTFSPRTSERNAYTASNLTGRTLDTILFSPLWGLGRGGAEKRHPFPEPASFWLLLFQEYGAIGLGLGLWFALSLMRQANRIALRSARVSERMVWSLIPVSGAAIMMTGLFSADLGSFHGIWGLFLLSGFIEGRHGQLFPRRLTSVAPLGRLKLWKFPSRPRRNSLPRGRPSFGRKRRRWRS